MAIASQAPSSNANRTITTSTQGSTLADVLERVLDKGIVIAGDISVSVGSTELLSIRIRLLISSVDKAREIGINWWESDPYLNSQSQTLLDANQQLLSRIDSLETELRSLKAAAPAPAPQQVELSD
ncbi:MAG: gas vesicle protein [Elainellaceae cyanobacterium]